MLKLKQTLIPILGLSICVSAHAERLIASSGKDQVQLIELYSSESCSSCPPADKWVSSLKDNKGLWKNFVPVVFHVDYWNDLGWKDGLSSNLMTRRQQEVARTWPKASVYTPAVVVNGNEWKDWSSKNIAEKTAPSDMKLSIYEGKNGDFEVVVDGLKSNAKEYTVRLAKLGMGISTDVTAGENSGRHLEHNFVVLNWEAKPVSVKNMKISFHFGASDKKSIRTALAVWIEKQGSPIPLQSAGGYL